jgi:hypothetical protein
VKDFFLDDDGFADARLGVGIRHRNGGRQKNANSETLVTQQHHSNFSTDRTVSTYWITRAHDIVKLSQALPYQPVGWSRSAAIRSKRCAERFFSAENHHAAESML